MIKEGSVSSLFVNLMEKLPQKNIANHSTLHAGRDIHIGDNNLFVQSTVFGVSTADSFLHKVSPDLLPEHIPKFDEYAEAIKAFFHAPNQQVLLISGSNESGKTHLLRELVIDRLEHNWNVLQIIPVERGFVLPSQSIDKPVLLFKDDIDWYGEDLLDKVLRTVESNPNVKLILTFHQLWRDKIDGYINKIKGLPGKCEAIILPPWKPEHLVEVLKLAAKMPNHPNEWDIVRQFPNPYLLKVFGETMAGEPSTPIENVALNFAQKIERTFKECLPSEWDDQRVATFILYLHFNRVRESDQQEVAAHFDLSEKSLQDILSRLKEVQMIDRPYGGYWHITPGVKGDFYLAKKMRGADAMGVKNLIPVLLEVNLEIVVAKFVAAIQFILMHNSDGVLRFLQKLMSDWGKIVSCTPDALITPQSVRAANKILSDVLTPQNIRAAREVLSLELRSSNRPSTSEIQAVTDAACSFVTSALLRQIVSNDTNCISFDIFTRAMSNTPYGAVYVEFLEELVKIPRKRSATLDILQEIWKRAWHKKDVNFPPEAILANAFKPLNEYNDADSFDVGLQYVQYWLLESGEPALHEMAVKALRTMLGVYFDRVSSEYSTTYFDTIPLPDDERIYQFRRKTLGFVLEALERDELRLDALEILKALGKGSNPSHPRDNLLKQFPKIVRELEMSIPSIGKLLYESKDFLVQKRAELILFHWWLWSASDTIDNWLLNFERPPEYDLYSYSLYRRIGEDFATLKSEAPEENRYEWYWKEGDMREKRRIERNEKYEWLTAQLSAKYKTADQIAEFIKDSAEKLTAWENLERRSSSVVNLTHIVQLWVANSPDSFSELMSKPDLFVNLPEWTRTQIEKKLVEVGKAKFDEIALPLLARIPDLTVLECHQLVGLIEQYNPLQKEEWLTRMVNEGTEELLTQIADRLYLLFSPEKETVKIASYLLDICLSGKITRETFFSGWNHDARECYRELSRHLDLIPSEIDEKLRRITFDLIKKMSRIDSSAEYVLRYCVRNVDHLIELFDYRATNFTIDNYHDHLDFVVREVLVESGFIPNELPGLFKTPENHRNFIDRFQEWELKAQMMSSDWKHRYLYITDPESKELWLHKHLKNALAENNVEATERYCVYIPIEDQYLPTMLQAWTKLAEYKTNLEMKFFLRHWIVDKEFSHVFQRPGYDFYARPMEILEWCTKQPGLNLLLKHLLDQIKSDLEKEQQKTRGDE